MIRARHAVVMAIIVLASEAISGGFGSKIAKPGASETYHGHYTFHREVSSFKPCGSDEQWWVDRGSETLRKHLTWPDGRVDGELYVEVVGIVSKRGSFGHLGAYDRELEIQSVSLKDAPRKTCSQ